MQLVGPDIYVQTFPFGVTVGVVVTPAGLVLIDTPTAPAHTRDWLNALSQFNRPLAYLINLDHHRDRTLNNQWFDAPVVAHELTHERARLLPDMLTRAGFADSGADDDLVAEPTGGRLVLPTLTFTDELTLLVGGRTLRLTHHPAHTPGGIWVELPAEGVAFVGDAVTHRAAPFLHEADLNRWLDDLADLRKKKNPIHTIVPGRGAPQTKDDLRSFEDALKTARRKLETLLKNRRPRLETALLVTELLPLFAPAPEQRAHHSRRLAAGLERLYETMHASQRAEAAPAGMDPLSALPPQRPLHTHEA